MFFFSSRRRHTRWPRDWSSDVCSSDLELGGTCLHRGCIPTKALLHAAEVADEARESARVGVRATFDGVDGPGLLAYQRSEIGRASCRERGILCIRAEGYRTRRRVAYKM